MWQERRKRNMWQCSNMGAAGERERGGDACVSAGGGVNRGSASGRRGEQIKCIITACDHTAIMQQSMGSTTATATTRGAAGGREARGGCRQRCSAWGQRESHLATARACGQRNHGTT